MLFQIPSQKFAGPIQLQFNPEFYKYNTET